jgi:peptide/nickel transport system permease protein
MTTYVVRRIVQGVLVLFVVSAVIFAIVHSAPGGPALLNQPDMDPNVAKEMRQALGLDDPVPIQYGRWLRNAYAGHFGKSYQHGITTSDLMRARIPNTLLLSGTALVLAVVLAVPLGTISALYRYSWLDYLATVVAFAGVSIPVFWLGILMIIVFSVTLG